MANDTLNLAVLIPDHFGRYFAFFTPGHTISGDAYLYGETTIPAFLESPDPRFVAARRSTMADAEGRFTFSKLPAGTYLVRSMMTLQEAADSVRQVHIVAALVTLLLRSISPGRSI